MKITDWPVLERPREKLKERGADALSDAELLAIFLRTGYAGVTAVDLARQLLKRFGGLSGVLSADCETLCAQPGVGIAKYIHLQASLEISNRHLASHLKRGAVIADPQMMRNYLAARFKRYEHEVFALLLLDGQMRTIVLEELFRGTLDRALVYPREVVKTALKYNAAFVVAVHNHPSGKAVASTADKTLTQRLHKALKLVDLKLLDHMIVAENQVLSLADAGLM